MSNAHGLMRLNHFYSSNLPRIKHTLLLKLKAFDVISIFLISVLATSLLERQEHLSAVTL
jgi:hypothetical protein